MCLFFWCHLGSRACAIAPVLSQYTSNGLDEPRTTPRSIRKFLIQTPSFGASKAAIYSASVVESATVSCLEIFWLIAPPFIVNIQIAIANRLSWSGSWHPCNSLHQDPHPSRHRPGTYL